MHSYLFNVIINVEGDFMNGNELKKELKWYDSGHTITSLIISTILIIIICSQSFVVGGGLGSFALFSSVINHNSIYFLILIYFILIKFSFGKKYFNYINIFLIFIYFIATITSALTVVQSFSLSTVFSFTLNFILVIYLSHTLFRDTRIWNDFYFYNSPFNELTNDWLFYAVVVISLFLLAINLISVDTISGVILSILDTCYVILFGRYIYLYRTYLDNKKIDVDNKGNFDAVREQIQNVLDNTDIDEKIIEVKDKIVDGAVDIKENIDTAIKENFGDSNKVKDVENDVKESKKVESGDNKEKNVVSDVKKVTSRTSSRSVKKKSVDSSKNKSSDVKDIKNENDKKPVRSTRTKKGDK